MQLVNHYNTDKQLKMQEIFLEDKHKEIICLEIKPKDLVEG